MKVIGIAGPSCSGKTTLAQHLTHRLEANLISLDTYYNTDIPKALVTIGGKTYDSTDRPEFWDAQRLAQDIKQLQKGKTTITILDFDKRQFVDKEVIKKEFLIIEGFLLLTYPELYDLCTTKFFVDIDMQTMIQRRLDRARHIQKDQDFAVFGPQEWHKYGAKQKEMKEVIVLDGTKNQATLLQEVIQLL